MFQSFADSYFQYLFEKEKKKQETFMAKILAMFQIQINDKKYYYILMENIFFGIEKDQKVQVYDLKGSQLNRLVIGKENANSNNNQQQQQSSNQGQGVINSEENINYVQQTNDNLEISQKTESNINSNGNESQVLQDTNFKIERNGQPVHINIKDLQVIIRGLKDDTSFLSDK